MGENFAFFLPIMMASFGLAFLFVWRWRARGAGCWSGAFFSVAGGFSIPLIDHALPMPYWGIVADLFFATGFLLFSQALLARWRPGWWLLPTRLAIWALSILLSTLGVLFDNLPLELVASDFGCFLLISIPLVVAAPRARAWPDRILFAVAILVALDNLVRGGTVQFTLAGAGGFLASQYAFLMQALACVFGLFLALSALAAAMFDILARYRDDAYRDPLSGLYNRRGFEERVERTALGSGRVSGSGCVILCDIDHFKTVNDSYGHATGDRVIVALAGILRAQAPADAIVARFGGEEFVVVLPDWDAAHAAELADRIRLHFAQDVGWPLELDRTLTASFGLTVRKTDDHSIHDAIARADAALYDAKRLGRNRVCVQRALRPTDTVARQA